MTMTITTTPDITPAQAEREMARRKAAKGTKKHAAFPKAHIMRASGAELRAVLAHEAEMLAAYGAAADMENPHPELAHTPVQVPAPALAETGPFWVAVRAGQMVEVDGILLPVAAAQALALAAA